MSFRGTGRQTFRQSQAVSSLCCWLAVDLHLPDIYMSAGWIISSNSARTQIRVPKCQTSNLNVNKLPRCNHLYRNDGGSRNGCFRNRSFHSQDTINRKCGYHFGRINLSWEPEDNRKVFTYQCVVPMWSNNQTDGHNISFFQLSEHFRDICQKQTFSAAFLPADWCLKCLKLWIFHRLQVFFGIPVFPCKTSGNKSMLIMPLLVFPWGWITIYGKEFEDTQRNQATQRNHSTQKLVSATEL